MIGHTGFVGQNLARQFAFDACFNSRTIGKSAGLRCRTLVCAAAPGSMFEANRQPDRDRAQIAALIAALDRIEADCVVLISTIAVLSAFSAEDEASASFEMETPYGLHRHLLESHVAARAGQVLVVRLPALHGAGLKKNFLFDLLNPMPSMLTPSRLEDLKEAIGGGYADLAAQLYRFDEDLSLFLLDRHALEASGKRRELDQRTTAAGMAASTFTNPASRFQYYDLNGLWDDICRCLKAGLETVHLGTAPIEAGLIHQRLVGATMPQNAARVHLEDMGTAQASLWGMSGRYIADQDEVLTRIERFVGARGGLR